MLRTYDFFENLLIDIEKGIRDGINSNILAQKYSISESHLRRLFKITFKQPLSGYIRSCRLAESLNDLFKTDAKLIYIALEYGFEYEQTYIRAFKCEFGITPGELRKERHFVKARRPLNQYKQNLPMPEKKTDFCFNLTL
jgi:AraC family transcriptional regulator